jgi:ComF family protein
MLRGIADPSCGLPPTRNVVMARIAREFGASLLDLLFPPKCLTCEALAEPFCPDCQAQIQPVAPGAPVPANLADIRRVGYHEDPLRKAVLLLKFGRKTALVTPLGELLAVELAAVAPTWSVDGLVPVPIHWTRRLERGFNQADLLARAAARPCGLPVLPALRRIRATPPQVGLTAGQRATNLRGAFAANPGWPVGGRRLALVDDVSTTGATLAGCAAVLRAAGAAEVYGLSITFDV